MKEPSAKRKRTLTLHDRALRFSVGVNACCPSQFTNLPSKVVWNQLVRAALTKLRLGSLDHFQKTAEQNLESEATQLAASFATIILNMRLRLDEEANFGKKSRKS